MNAMKCYVLHGPRDMRSESKPIPEIPDDSVLIRIAAVGICGSDVHYYLNGSVGDFVLRDPFVLGHEFSGRIEKVGEGVTGFSAGDRVTVEPALSCGWCPECVLGRYNLCRNMRTFGSASSYPHLDGGMAEYVVAPERSCYRLPNSLDFKVGALVEPLAVAAHAIVRAGNVFGKSVFVTGGGTIGQSLLTLLRSMGIGKIAVSDPDPFRREFSLLHGADVAFDSRDADFRKKVEEFVPLGFDLLFEASGSPSALSQAMEAAARGATLVQIGSQPKQSSIPGHLTTSKEMQILGSFRYAHVFGTVIDLVSRGALTVDHLITHVFDFSEQEEAFRVAVTGDHAIKVQMTLS